MLRIEGFTVEGYADANSALSYFKPNFLIVYYVYKVTFSGGDRALSLPPLLLYTIITVSDHVYYSSVKANTSKVSVFNAIPKHWTKLHLNDRIWYHYNIRMLNM